MMSDSLVFDIQRFCLHDGPGIRTVVFLKGCPLSCKWCCNPESQSFQPELIQFARLCIACGRCTRECPSAAVTTTDCGPLVDRALCNNCGDCTDVCPTGALAISGRKYDPDELATTLLRDRAFFEVSGGGVTFSGGEPLAHPDFLAKMLVALQATSIHAAVETSGYAPWGVFEKIIRHTDLFLFDLKHMDKIEHLSGTGVTNQRVLENLTKLADATRNIVVRIPLIPGYNMDTEHLLTVTRFVHNLGIEQVHLLPYHRLGQSKYRSLSRGYELDRLTPPGNAEIADLEKFLRSEVKLNISVRGT